MKKTVLIIVALVLVAVAGFMVGVGWNTSRLEKLAAETKSEAAVSGSQAEDAPDLDQEESAPGEIIDDFLIDPETGYFKPNPESPNYEWLLALNNGATAEDFILDANGYFKLDPESPNYEAILARMNGETEEPEADPDQTPEEETPGPSAEGISEKPPEEPTEPEPDQQQDIGGRLPRNDALTPEQWDELERYFEEMEAQGKLTRGGVPSAGEANSNISGGGEINWNR